MKFLALARSKNNLFTIPIFWGFVSKVNTFYYGIPLEFVEKVQNFPFSLHFLYFYPRDFLFFQMYENYCKNSPNGEI